jgi:phosphoenolpyruvate carboxykinase (ATP)
VNYYKDPVFGFEVPYTCPGIPDHVLEPWSAWPSREEYDKKYKQLAQRFIDNFAKYSEGMPREIVEAGPQLA